MTTKRIIETTRGITGEVTVAQYDTMMKSHRDRGWLNTAAMIKFGIDHGVALEIGPGPGYLGLEWLQKTKGTELVGMDISRDMIDRARENANDYGLGDRIRLIHSDGKDMDIEARSFDAVFSNGSLHEWEEPVTIFNNIFKVLKPGGRFFIGDLRRDLNWLVIKFMQWTLKPKSMLTGLSTSIQAAYTKSELKDLMQQSDFTSYVVKRNLFGLDVMGWK